MKTKKWLVFLLGVATGVLALELVRVPSHRAEAQEGKLPFANSVDQRQQSVEELRRLNALMQKQLDLLTSGKVRVVVVDDRADGGRKKAE